MKKLILLSFLALSIFSQAQEVKWLSIEDAEKKSIKKPKPLLIDVYTDWCGWCKKMDASTYSNEMIVDYINKNYYPVKFNAEQKDSIVFMSHTFKFIAQGRRGYHELAASLLNGKMSYPSTVFLTGKFEMIQNIPGYLDEKTMYPILVYLKEELNKEMSYEDFLKSFNEEK